MLEFAPTYSCVSLGIRYPGDISRTAPRIISHEEEEEHHESDNSGNGRGDDSDDKREK